MLVREEHNIMFVDGMVVFMMMTKRGDDDV